MDIPTLKLFPFHELMGDVIELDLPGSTRLYFTFPPALIVKCMYVGDP